MFENILTSIGDAVGPWMYVIAGFLVFAEAALLVGFVLPGETALLVAGAFCHYGNLHLSLTIVVAVVCAIVGDTVGFEVGRHYGDRLRNARVGRWVGEKRWEAVDRTLARRGGEAVFIARLTALLRAVMPFAAGSSRMRYPTFLAWNAAGGVLWGSGVVLLGWAFANALSTVGSYLTWAPLVVVGLVVVFFVVRHLRGRRAEEEDSPTA